MKTTILVTAEQLSDLLQVEVGKVRRMTKEGVIPFVDLGPNTKRYDPELVKAALIRSKGRGPSEHAEGAGQ